MNGLKQREQSVSSKNDFECYFKHSAQFQLFRTDFVVERKWDYWVIQTFDLFKHILMCKTLAF